MIADRQTYTDKQTHRQSDTLITILDSPIGGRVTIFYPGLVIACIAASLTPSVDFNLTSEIHCESATTTVSYHSRKSDKVKEIRTFKHNIQTKLNRAFRETLFITK